MFLNNSEKKNVTTATYALFLRDARWSKWWATMSKIITIMSKRGKQYIETKTIVSQLGKYNCFFSRSGRGCLTWSGPRSSHVLPCLPAPWRVKPNIYKRKNWLQERDLLRARAAFVGILTGGPINVAICLVEWALRQFSNLPFCTSVSGLCAISDHLSKLEIRFAFKSLVILFDISRTFRGLINSMVGY